MSRRRATRRRPSLGRRPLRTPLRQQLDGTLGRERLHVVAAPEARVRLAVGDVGPEAALLEHDRLAGGWIRAELLQRRLRRGAATSFLWFREELERLVQGDREQLLLRLERPRLVALLHVRAVAAVLRSH